PGVRGLARRTAGLPSSSPLGGSEAGPHRVGAAPGGRRVHVPVQDEVLLDGRLMTRRSCPRWSRAAAALALARRWRPVPAVAWRRGGCYTRRRPGAPVGP